MIYLLFLSRVLIISPPFSACFCFWLCRAVSTFQIFGIFQIFGWLDGSCFWRFWQVVCSNWLTVVSIIAWRQYCWEKNMTFTISMIDMAKASVAMTILWWWDKYWCTTWFYWLILMSHLLMKKDVHHLHDLCLGKTSQLCPGGGNCRKRRLLSNIKVSSIKESKYQSIKYKVSSIKYHVLSIKYQVSSI